jgi:hypothetical protein
MGFEQQNMVMIIDKCDELMLVDDKFGDSTSQHIWDSYHNPSWESLFAKPCKGTTNSPESRAICIVFCGGGGFLQKSKPKPLEWLLKIGCWPFYMDFQLEIVG